MKEVTLWSGQGLAMKVQAVNVVAVLCRVSSCLLPGFAHHDALWLAALACLLRPLEHFLFVTLSPVWQAIFVKFAVL